MSEKQSSDTDDDIVLARKKFEQASEAENHNRLTYVDDTKFSRLEEQWPQAIREERERSGRPCLTIDKTKAFIRQVVNDARQNKPAVKVRPADSESDPETAEVMSGLIRNIEYTSNADVAYDTAVECAVGGGFGYFRLALDYAFDDAFEMDIRFDRITNPLSVYGDPNSRAADSSDWNDAFIVERITHEEFRARFGDKAMVDWDDDSAWSQAGETWRDENEVMIAEWWHREEVEKEIVQLSDGSVYSTEALETDPDLAVIPIMVEMGQLQIVNRRKTRSHKVTQRIISGVEVLETNDWPGRYIPIVPVYGDEFDVQGKRYLRSLIHPAKDAQRMFNYWRTTSTELVALAPRTPYIGEEGAFDADIDRWNTINTKNHPFVEYAQGKQLPQRQPLDGGVAAGALQEALNASDDMKAIMGLYDASLGARSNETSGRAILARQREGDVSTFHFVDNLNRAIRHAGRILLDLIPKVYTEPRMVRVIGEDGSQESVRVNQPFPATDQEGRPLADERGKAILRTHDLTAGKYDLVVESGPSFTTRREEAAFQMTEMIRALPASAPILGKHLAKNLDWPGADEIAEELEALAPKPGGLPPEVQQQIEQGLARIQELEQENQQLKADRSVEAAKVAEDRRSNLADERIDAFEAQTGRMKAMADSAAKFQPRLAQQHPQR